MLGSRTEDEGALDDSLLDACDGAVDTDIAGGEASAASDEDVDSAALSEQAVSISRTSAMVNTRCLDFARFISVPPFQIQYRSTAIIRSQPVKFLYQLL